MAGDDGRQGAPGQARPVPGTGTETDGVVIRAASLTEAGAVARIYIDCWHSGYHGILPAAFAERLDLADQTEIWHAAIRTPGNATLVAVSATGELVGFVCGGPERSGSTAFFAEIYGLYVLPEHRERAVGRRLFLGFCRQLTAIGLRSLLVRVLEANPICGFYERLGASEQENRLVRVAGRSLNEVAYGWRDISPATRKSDRA